MKKYNIILLFSLLFSTITVSYAQQTDTRSEREKQQYRQALISTGAVFSNIQRFFVDTVDLVKVSTVGLNALLQRLDPYTEYFTPEQAKAFGELTTGQYAGIGAIISERPNKTVIINEPFAGQPADVAGLKSGDRILSIDGKDFSKKASSPEVSKALRGADNSKIKLVVKRPGVAEPLSFTFKRKIININSVPYFGRLDGNIGIIRLNTFSKDTGKDVREALESLLAEGPLDGLILDLRSNGGGILQTAVDMLSLFLPVNTLVVKVIGRQPDTNANYMTTKEPLVPSLPMAVLINGESASASEIVAGALQDTDRAVIMGQKSFGKGLVQSTVALPGNALMKLTTAQYYIPSGRNIQKIAYHHLNDTVNKEDEENTASSMADADTIAESDSLGAPYYTKSGRAVYATDGILPDITLSVDTLPAIISFMAVDTLVFDYITDYVQQHKEPLDPATFHLSNQDFDAFCKEMTQKHFTYKPASAYLLERLEKTIKEEKREVFLKKELHDLKSSFMPNIEEELRQYKNEIVDFLEGQILLRKCYRRGFFAKMLPSDPQVKEAIKLLKDQKRYKTLLLPLR